MFYIQDNILKGAKIMNFDIRTRDSARQFVLEFMNMTSNEFETEYNCGCQKDFDEFWERNFDRIQKVDILNIKIMAFHILGALDECEEIKKNGLKNLKEVLSNDTLLKKKLSEAGIEFDIPGKIMMCNGTSHDINYDKYKGELYLSDLEEKLRNVARRVYYDFFINGFLFNDDVYSYGTKIHKRPEFIMHLSELFKSAKDLENDWMSQSKSYRIDFYATIDQVTDFTFDLNAIQNPPFDDWWYLDDDMKIKKWMLSHAIDRANNMISEKFVYIKDKVIIPPDQIVEISELK